MVMLGRYDASSSSASSSSSSSSEVEEPVAKKAKTRETGVLPHDIRNLSLNHLQSLEVDQCSFSDFQVSVHCFLVMLNQRYNAMRVLGLGLGYLDLA